MSDPLQSGLSAGQDAYNGAAPKKRLGISAADLSGLRNTVQSGLSDAAAQRQTLATNAAKQAAGYYPATGTSAAAYNYLRGQGGYPVNAVPSGQPVNTGIPGYGGVTPAAGGTNVLPSRTTPTGLTTIQKPYENAVNTGTNTQTKLATDAQTGQTKMGKVTQPTINMPKPSLVNQLLATAGPMYLGYTLLDKAGITKGIGSAWDKLWGSDALPAGVDASSTQALIDQYYTNPSIDLASAGSEDALQILADREAARIAAEEAAARAAAEAAAAEAAAASSTPGIAGATTGATTAGGAGLTEAATAGGAGLTEAAGWDAATAGEYGGPAAALSEEEAAALAEANGMDWAAMATEYGPYVAAAIIADQVTGGKISNAVGDVVQGAGNVIGDVAQGAGDIISGGVNTVRSWFGLAEGGQVKGRGLAAAYADGGGIAVGAPNPFRQTVGVDDGPSSFAANDAQSLMYQNNPTVSMARGGISHLGDFSDGGRLLRGPGDGVSDSIPATIGGKQPARLANNEFVIPARIVSEIGNGSTDAGARKLYQMMDRVQAARKKSIGKGRVAVDSKAHKAVDKL